MKEGKCKRCRFRDSSKASYEMKIRDTKASLARLGEAIATYDITVKRITRPAGAVFLYVRMGPEIEEEVSSYLKVLETWHRPPCFFNNGSLIPIYDSPQDEVEGIYSKSYEEFLEQKEVKTT